eukprot:Gb_37419 [translate_table: standard]
MKSIVDTTVPSGKKSMVQSLIEMNPMTANISDTQEMGVTRGRNRHDFEGDDDSSDFEIFDTNTEYSEDSDADDWKSACEFESAHLDEVQMYSDKQSQHPSASIETKPIDIVYQGQDGKVQTKVSGGAINRNTTKPKEQDWRKKTWERKRGQVLMEGFVEEPLSSDDIKGSDLCDESEEGTGTPKQPLKTFSRTKSLTDEDLDELKGCVDLGFGFNYEEIPELCNTLPALELCYSMSQKFQDDQQKSPVSTIDGAMSDTSSNNGSYAQSPIANWKISSPGDHPEQVKARLKFWAQVVACTVRLCS